MFTLIPGQWDLQSFLENSQSYAAILGNAFLLLLGTVAIIYGGYLLIKKLMAGQQNQDSWVKIVLLIIIGGMLFVSGFDLLSTIASGGQQTITDLGTGGFILPFLGL